MNARSSSTARSCSASTTPAPSSSARPKSDRRGLPPYGVEELGDGRVRITLAVAGFTSAQLDVTVEDNQLNVAGRRDGPETERAYLHRGIAARGFVRSFILADGMEVEGAVLEHGLLHIELYRPEPEKKVKHIPIRTAG